MRKSKRIDYIKWKQKGDGTCEHCILINQLGDKINELIAAVNQLQLDKR